MTKHFSILTKFPHSKLFFRIFSGLFLLFFSLLLLGFGERYKLSVQNSRKQIYTASMNELTQANKIIETNIQILAVNLDQILSSDTCLSYITSPEADLEYQLSLELAQLKEKFQIVEEAWFYFPQTDLILQNGCIISSLSEFEDAEALSFYEDQWNIVPLNSLNTAQTYLATFYYSKRLFITAELSTSQDSGILLCELNTKVLNKLLENSEDNTNIYFFDALSHEISSSGTLYPVLTTILTEASPDSDIFNATSGYYMLQSDLTSWRYVFPIDTEEVSLNLTEIAIYTFPVLLLIITVSAGLSYLLASTIYAPIHRVIQMISEKASSPYSQTDYNEIQYLENVYTSILNEQTAFHQQIEKIAPQLMEWTYHALLTGNETEQKSLQILLDALNLENIHDNYMICSIELCPETSSFLSAVDKDKYFLIIEKKICAECQTDCVCYPYRTNDSSLTVLFVFPASQPLWKFQHKYDAIKEQVQKLFASLPFHPLIEDSGIHQELKDMHYYYQKILMNIEYRRTASKKPFLLQGEQASELYYIEGRIQQCLTLIQDNQFDQATELFAHVLDETKQTSPSLDSFCQKMLTFMSNVVKQIHHFPIPGAKKGRNNSSLSFHRGFAPRHYIYGGCRTILQATFSRYT
ncbi:MAG: hypothetical protein LUE23_02105 [Lachnospiraceae bacterium]|nr:hypothetical protein [Lachnospiraceae bacterium]